MKTQSANRLQIMAALLTGLVGFLLVAGPRVLDPGNVAWLRASDPATHYLGWTFFRQSPWQFPLGLNPDYGLELSSSIVFSDSIPLLALPLKLLDAWLPQPFQYLGLWLLACFMLQGYFGWKLAGLVSNRAILRLLTAALLVLSPPMLVRLAGHWSLCSHFLILAALYLALRPETGSRRSAWALLLMGTALIHGYILAMLLLLWLADLAGRTWKGQLQQKLLPAELAGMVLLVGLTCWQAGYFSVGDGINDGSFYGYYRTNLLALLDSSNWSLLLKDLPQGPGDYEGFSYLGLGIILLALTLLPRLPALMSDLWTSLQRHPFLTGAMLVLAAFAVTQKPALGLLEFSYPLPEFLLRTAETFRASGRMFWPCFYLVAFWVIASVIKQNRHGTATGLLALAVLVQLVDTHAGWQPLRSRLMTARSELLATPPTAAFWEEAGQHYQNIRVLPPANMPQYWLNIAAFAATHDMGTNAVYLARIDRGNYAIAAQKSTDMLTTGNYEPDTLYILADQVVDQARSTLRPEDLLGSFDGVTVLAPGWVNLDRNLQR